MYIIKNALRCISRSKGRNVLIGIIVLVISVSACIGLSIRQAAENARSETLENMSITATISFDRRSAMQGMTPPEQGGTSDGSAQGGFDRDSFKEMMGKESSLTLEEYETYAKASSVKDFYYTATASVNGNDDLEPVSNETESDETQSQSQNNFPGGMGGGKGGFNRVMGAQSDFSLIGVSGEKAMTDFINGNATVTQGEIFEEGTESLECIISEELATFNDLELNDSIKITNPNNEDEAYSFKIVGIFTDNSANENSFSMMGMTADDPANKIYISYPALSVITAKSEKVSETVTDENTGREYETALTASITATYSFADVDAYNTFEDEVRDLGLEDSYTVSSNDLTAFENSLTPLTTLSKTAGYFLIVILIIGAIILVVLNIFNVRERKYEIGVLTAMGMKKGKVALQFLTEIFVVTLIAVIIGAGIGAVSSVPVANALLQNQIESASTRQETQEANFGIGSNKGGENAPADMPQMPDNGGFGDRIGDFMTGTADYVDEISSATDFTVLLQMLGIAVILTLIAGAASMLFIMRYEPLRILSNRD